MAAASGGSRLTKFLGSSREQELKSRLGCHPPRAESAREPAGSVSRAVQIHGSSPDSRRLTKTLIGTKFA